MSAYNVTTAATGALPPAHYDFIFIRNYSDATVFLKIDGSEPTLTPANGLPLLANEMLALEDPSRIGIYDNGVQVIHGATGNKEIRIQAHARGN